MRIRPRKSPLKYIDSDPRNVKMFMTLFPIVGMYDVEQAGTSNSRTDRAQNVGRAFRQRLQQNSILTTPRSFAKFQGAQIFQRKDPVAEA